MTKSQLRLTEPIPFNEVIPATRANDFRPRPSTQVAFKKIDFNQNGKILM